MTRHILLPAPAQEGRDVDAIATPQLQGVWFYQRLRRKAGMSMPLPRLNYKAYGSTSACAGRQGCRCHCHASITRRMVLPAPAQEGRDVDAIATPQLQGVWFYQRLRRKAGMSMPLPRLNYKAYGSISAC